MEEDGRERRAGDTSRDGRVTREELAVWLSLQQEEAEEVTVELPEWFTILDSNGDGQVQMAEYATEWSEQKITNFQQYDLNDDGIITPDECIEADGDAQGHYAVEEMLLIGPGSTIVSTLEIEDDIIIKDLNVQLSITHTYASHLDAYLIGPEGEQVELFTKVGEHDNNFENTIFDDESELPIYKARVRHFAAYFDPRR